MKGGRLKHRYLGNTDFLDYRVTDKKVHNSNGGKESITEHELTIETAKQCESLTPFSMSCIVIVERGPTPNLSRIARGESLPSFLFSIITLYKSILVGFSVITFWRSSPTMPL